MGIIIIKIALVLVLTLTSCKQMQGELNNWAKQNSLKSTQGTQDNSISKISAICPKGSTLDVKLSTESKKMCKTLTGTVFPAADAFQEYYSNGNPKTLLVHNGNNLLRINWYENGRMKEESRYQNNEKEGPWSIWFENGNLKETGIYKSGKRNGIFSTFYDNGKINEKTEYRNDTRNGLSIKHDDRGRNISRETFLNNIKHGNAEYFYTETKKISSHGAYANNKYFGKWINYNQNGTRASVGTYDADGNKHGEWKFYDEKGLPSRSEHYANGEVGKKLELKANVVFNNEDQIGAKPPEYRPKNRFKPQNQVLPTEAKKGWQPL